MYLYVCLCVYVCLSVCVYPWACVCPRVSQPVCIGVLCTLCLYVYCVCMFLTVCRVSVCVLFVCIFVSVSVYASVWVCVCVAMCLYAYVRSRAFFISLFVSSTFFFQSTSFNPSRNHTHQAAESWISIQKTSPSSPIDSGCSSLWLGSKPTLPCDRRGQAMRTSFGSWTKNGEPPSLPPPSSNLVGCVVQEGSVKVWCLP